MCSALKQARDTLKAAVAATLEQYYRVGPALRPKVLDKLFGIAVERRAASKERGIERYILAHAYKVVDTRAAHGLGDAAIELLLRDATLANIRDYGHTAATHRLQV